MNKLKYWVTKEGKELDIKFMKTDHIKRCIAMLKRSGFISESEWIFYDNYYGSDNDNYCFMDVLTAQRQALNCTPNKKIDMLEKELERRKEEGIK